MAEQEQDSSEEALIRAPRSRFRKSAVSAAISSAKWAAMFWFIMHTFEETIERLRDGRAPFRAVSFFSGTLSVPGRVGPTGRAGVFFSRPDNGVLTGYQLQRFGTERLIPGLVSIAFTRELGPLMTGIMLAARIGASFTAELGTMQVSEEIEAIEAMGIGPLRFLVAPRMLALFFLMPCLSTVSNISAIFASSLISKAYFSIAFPYFLDLVRDSLLIRDLITGVFKSFMFGLLIAAIACYRGLSVKGGAAGVEPRRPRASSPDHGRDRRRYALQHRLRQLFPDMSEKNSHMVELRDVEMQFEDKKCSMAAHFRSSRAAPCDHGQSGSGKSTILRLDSGN